jgi:hypothetical protein
MFLSRRTPPATGLIKFLCGHDELYFKVHVSIPLLYLKINSETEQATGRNPWKNDELFSFLLDLQDCKHIGGADPPHGVWTTRVRWVFTHPFRGKRHVTSLQLRIKNLETTSYRLKM